MLTKLIDKKLFIDV